MDGRSGDAATARVTTNSRASIKSAPPASRYARANIVTVRRNGHNNKRHTVRFWYNLWRSGSTVGWFWYRCNSLAS